MPTGPATSIFVGDAPITCYLSDEPGEFLCSSPMPVYVGGVKVVYLAQWTWDITHEFDEQVDNVKGAVKDFYTEA